MLLSLTKGATIAIIAVGAVVILLAIIIVCVYISMRNGLVRLVNDCENAWADIDVYLKKRYDLIPNLVETVKGYCKHESETLERVIAARNAAVAANTPNAIIDAENVLGGALKKLFSLKESYPELKANSGFLSLQNQLNSIETDLSQARKFYNAKCRVLNTKIDVFPSNLAARSMGLAKRKYFEITEPAERENVRVSF